MTSQVCLWWLVTTVQKFEPNEPKIILAVSDNTLCVWKHLQNNWNLRQRSSIGNLLTPWSRVLVEKLTGSAASQEILRLFGTRRFLTLLTSARHLSLSWANSIQSPQPPPISWWSILILSFFQFYCVTKWNSCLWVTLPLLSFEVVISGSIRRSYHFISFHSEVCDGIEWYWISRAIATEVKHWVLYKPIKYPYLMFLHVRSVSVRIDKWH